MINESAVINAIEKLGMAGTDNVPGLVMVRQKLEARKTAEALAARFTKLRVVCVTSTDASKKTRKSYADEMKAGQIDIAVATPVWFTGIDIPQLKWAIWAGGGQAPIQLLQASGRVVRPDQSKAAMGGYKIIDLVDVSLSTGVSNARKRAEHWEKAGYSMTSDADFIDEILSKSAGKNHKPNGIYSQHSTSKRCTGLRQSTTDAVYAIAPGRFLTILFIICFIAAKILTC